MKILIIGHGRHGKDTLAEIWRDQFGLKFQSSSEAAAEIFLYKKLKDKYGYKSFRECYEDRHNHRMLWKNEISAYNTPNPTRLARKITEKNDAYVGMRDLREADACVRRGVFDLVVWVDASKRIMEKDPSMQIPKSFAHVCIDNNGTVSEFKTKAHALGRAIFKNHE